MLDFKLALKVKDINVFLSTGKINQIGIVGERHLIFTFFFFITINKIYINIVGLVWRIAP